MDVADRDDGDAGHGDDEFAVFLDAFDVAFGAFVDAVGHAHAVARVVLRRVGAEVLHVAARLSGGDEDERAHLLVADGPGRLALGIRVVHEILVVAVLEVHEPFLLAAHEHQRGDQLLLFVDQPPGVQPLHGMDRDIGLDALMLEEGLDMDHPVVENLEGVPMESGRGRVCELKRHGGGYFFHSPALLKRRSGKSRIWREGPARQPCSYPRADAANPYCTRSNPGLHTQYAKVHRKRDTTKYK